MTYHDAAESQAETLTPPSSNCRTHGRMVSWFSAGLHAIIIWIAGDTEKQRA